MSFKDEQQLQDDEESQWSNITNDILALILKRLNTRVDLCRFTSICKPWRIFAYPPQQHVVFPITLPSMQPNSKKLSLFPTVVYLFSKPISNNSEKGKVWVGKVVEIDGQKWDLLNPLTNYKLYFSSRVFNKRINLMGFRNYEVGRSYRVQIVSNSVDDDSSFDFDDFSSSISVKKLVVNFNYDDSNKFSVLGLFNSGEIAIWNVGDYNWTVIQIGEEKENQFDDVICYNGKFFAVDKRGKLVMINPITFEVNQIVDRMKQFEGLMMYIYLIEANYKLYMVNKIVNPRPVNFYDEEEEEWVVDKSSVGKPLGFNVYVLEEKETVSSWVKVNSVGNKVLFVSRDATFSICSEDLGWSKGNCVYFEGLTGYDDEADMKFGLNAGVYNLEDGTIVTFDSLSSRWTEIFWPDLRWFSNVDGGYPEHEMED